MVLVSGLQLQHLGFSHIPTLVAKQAGRCLEWESKGKVNFLLCGLP